MANMYWRGGSIAAAQITDFTPGTGLGTLYSLVAYDDEGHSYALASVSPGSVQAAVEALKAQADSRKAEGVGPWDEITATENDSKLTLTCDTAGKPIYFDVSACVGDTITVVDSQVNKGPYDWNDLTNWDGDGDLPGADASDAVYVENAIIKYGLNQSAIANALTALYITKSQIGQNSIDNNGPSYLQIKSSKVDINYNNEPVTITLLSPVNVDTGATASTITVHNSPVSSVGPAVNIKSASASTVLHVLLGSVGYANNADETGQTVGDINVLGGTCNVGAGVTLTNMNCRAGASVVRCALTTLNLDSGTVKTDGVGAITTVNVNGGTATLNSSGTITALNAVKGTADFTKSSIARTVTTAKVGIGGVIKYEPATVTMTNKVQPYNTTGDITITGS